MEPGIIGCGGPRHDDVMAFRLFYSVRHSRFATIAKCWGTFAYSFTDHTSSSSSSEYKQCLPFATSDASRFRVILTEL